LALCIEAGFPALLERDDSKLPKGRKSHAADSVSFAPLFAPIFGQFGLCAH